METRTEANGDRRAELLELYGRALEDYRFQVQLNWGRSQYFLVLNVTIVGISTGILQLANGPYAPLVAVLYFVGFLFCVFSVVALAAQQRYYESAREQKTRFEEDLGLGRHKITPAQRRRGKIARLFTFKGFVNLMFFVLGAANLGCAAFVLLWA